MKPKFPHEYIVSVDRISAAVATLTAPPRPTLVGGPPPEFQGDAHVWSPEHLLAAALGLCLFTTFEAFAAREHLDILGYRDVATGVLDRTSSGLAFKSFTICVELTVAPEDIERASAILERASRTASSREP